MIGGGNDENGDDPNKRSSHHACGCAGGWGRCRCEHSARRPKKAKGSWEFARRSLSHNIQVDPRYETSPVRHLIEDSNESGSNLNESGSNLNEGGSDLNESGSNSDEKKSGSNKSEDDTNNNKKSDD